MKDLTEAIGTDPLHEVLMLHDPVERIDWNILATSTHARLGVHINPECVKWCTTICHMLHSVKLCTDRLGDGNYQSIFNGFTPV